jgi:hypothetical protein
VRWSISLSDVGVLKVNGRALAGSMIVADEAIEIIVTLAALTVSMMAIELGVVVQQTTT